MLLCLPSKNVFYDAVKGFLQSITLTRLYNKHLSSEKYVLMH
jgi:hypothetical protein